MIEIVFHGVSAGVTEEMSEAGEPLRVLRLFDERSNIAVTTRLPEDGARKIAGLLLGSSVVLPGTALDVKGQVH